MTITIDEAIEILDNDMLEHHSLSTDRLGKAMQLGIVAMKRFQEGRQKGFISTVLLLPGETEGD